MELAAAVVGPDFQIRRWTNDEGLPQNRVDCLWPMRDGHLLIGTPAGLLRFDGFEFGQALSGPGADWLRASVCTALLEDRDGRLWVGTKRGLGCWDADGFRSFDSRHGLPGQGIHCLAPARDGGLWIGSDGGLAWWDGIRFQSHPPPVPAALFVHAVLDQDEDTVWVGSSAGLHRFNPRTGRFSEVWAAPAKPSGDPGHGAESLAAGLDGRLWFGTRGGVGSVEAASGEVRAPPPVPPVSPGNQPGLLLRSARDVWTFGPGGVAIHRGGHWLAPKAAQEFDGVTVRCAVKDRDGNLWLGTASDGLWRLRPRTVHAPELPPGSENVAAWSICSAREGGVWMATDRGLLRLSGDHPAGALPVPDLPEISLRCVLETRRGDLWVGTAEHGLRHFRRGPGSFVGVPMPARPHQVRALLEDRSGAVWVGTKDGLMRFGSEPVGSVSPGDAPQTGEPPAQWHFRPRSTRYRAGSESWLEEHALWRPDSDPGSPGLSAGELRARPGADWAGQIPEGRLTDGDIHAVLEDRWGRLWIGTDRGGLNRLSGGRFEAWGARDGLGSDAVYALYEDGEGVLWIGTPGGLVRWQEGAFFPFAGVHGLPEPLVNQIVEDGQGCLWLGSHRGLTRVRRDALNAVAEGRSPRVQALLLGRSDGLPASETNGEVQPAGTRTPDGLLWFPTTHGPAVVDPRAVFEAPPPAPVLIEAVRATDHLLTRPFPNGRIAGAGQAQPGHREAARDAASVAVTLRAGSGRFLDFRYVAVDLTAPESTRYRYQLDGHDDRWIEAGRQRTVSYANLPPGDYRFRVSAADRHGRHSPAPAEFAFALLPYWHQTGWARAGAIGVFAAFVAGFHHLRVRGRIARERVASENRLAGERSRISRDLHDDLGAWLARTQLLLDRLRRHPAPPADWSQRLGEVEESVRCGRQTMREVIWTTNPENDTLEELGSRIAVFATEYLGPLGVRCRLDFPVSWPDLTARAELRQTFLLTVKEALHNAVEHGRAPEIRLALRLSPGHLLLEISDNGRGMDGGTPADPAAANDAPAATPPPAGPGRGSGLVNIRHRVESLGGRLDVASDPVRGTTLGIAVPL